VRNRVSVENGECMVSCPATKIIAWYVLYISLHLFCKGERLVLISLCRVSAAPTYRLLPSAMSLAASGISAVWMGTRLILLWERPIMTNIVQSTPKKYPRPL
jgi:hypothetical protein